MSVRPVQSQLSVSEPATCIGSVCSGIASKVLAFVLAGSVFLAGCSFMIVKPAKVDDEPNPECTTSALGPAIDTILAVPAWAGAIYLSSFDKLSGKEILLPTAYAWAGLWTVAAVWGAINNSKCKDYQSELWGRRPSRRPPAKPPTGLPDPGLTHAN